MKSRSPSRNRDNNVVNAGVNPNASNLLNVKSKNTLAGFTSFHPAQLGQSYLVGTVGNPLY